MTKILCLSNHKGGVGKTTSTINIGAGLTKLGKNVLLIDLDPQANLSQSLGIVDAPKNIYGAIRGEYKLQPINIYENFDIVPSTLDLSGAEMELISEAGREYILRELIEPVKEKYDYILIDCPPSIGLLTVNALTAADEVLIPLQAEFLAVQGLKKLTEIIEKVKLRLNKNLKIGGVFITQFDSRKILNKNVAESVEAHFKTKMFSTKIRENVALAEAPAQGYDIFRYDINANGAKDYLSLSNEILMM
jgi:chromosome partitioning protein